MFVQSELDEQFCYGRPNDATEHLINTIFDCFYLRFESKTSNKTPLKEAEHPHAPDHNYNRHENTETNQMAIENNIPNTVLPNQNDKNVTIQADAERILDLIRWDANSEVKCLVKYKGIEKPRWVPVDDIKRVHPTLLIDYYETRIILRKQQCEMAFERTTSPHSVRKLVVIQ